MLWLINHVDPMYLMNIYDKNKVPCKIKFQVLEKEIFVVHLQPSQSPGQKQVSVVILPLHFIMITDLIYFVYFCIRRSCVLAEC